MLYEVNINGQPLGRMERADIERRAAAWKSAGAQAEILDPVSHLSVSLAAFLARPPRTVPSAPGGLIDQFDSNIPQGHYEVRVNGQLIGTLSAPDILRRAHIWPNASVEIASPVTGALALNAWCQRIAARFDPLLWPASGDARGYSIRVCGQSAPKHATRSEIEWQAANGVLDPGAEIVDDQGASAPLHDFLAGNFPARQPAPTPSTGPAPSPPPSPSPVYHAPIPVIQPFGHGPYYVRVGASTLGPLDRDDIERRAANWPSGTVQVAESTAGPFVPLADFLRMPRPAAAQTAAAAAQAYVPFAAQYPTQPPPATIQPQGKPFHPLLAMVLALITCNIFWLFWLYRSYKFIRSINPKATTITPATAVGFLFVPIFNLFWLVRIAIDLPRSAARAVGTRPGAASTLATVMFLAGFFWSIGFAFPMPYVVLWIAAFELLILGFVGYCQSVLNRAFPSATARPNSVLYSTFGVSVICGLVALWFVLAPRFFPPNPDILVEQAQQALNSGDFAGAANLLEKAGTPDAKVQLATLYKNGLGVSQDNQKAVFILTDAANSGSLLAQNMLGLWYANGDGVQQDSSAAIDWYRKAADQGNADAASLIALAYEGGDGVEQDPAKAYMWFTVATREGSSYANSERKVLGEALGDSQRFQAESDANQEFNRIGRKP